MTEMATYQEGRGLEILDFPVSLEKLEMVTESGARKEVEGKLAVVRNDTESVLSIVSNSYNLIPHVDVVEAAEAGMMEAGFEWNDCTTATDMKASRFTRTYNMKEEGEVVSGDVLRSRIRIVSSYNTSTGIGVFLDSFRLVCTNGLYGWSSENRYYVKHTGGVSTKVFQSATQNVAGKWSELLATYGDWAEQELSAERGRLLLKMFSLKHHTMSLFSQEMDSWGGGSRWDLYNIFTANLTHNYMPVSATAELRRIDLGEQASKLMEDTQLVYNISTDELEERVATLEDKEKKRQQNSRRTSGGKAVKKETIEEEIARLEATLATLKS